jgi:hypothetical protein
MPNELTITLSGEDGFVSADALIEALENTIKILRHLETQFPVPEKIRWEIIRASMQSPLALTLAARATEPQAQAAGDRIVRAAYQGLRAVSTAAVRPPYFDDESLAAAKELVSEARSEGAQLSIVVPDEEPLIPTETLVENVERVIAGTRTHHEYGTIEGRLEQVSTHKTDSFSVWEIPTDHKVECLATPEQLEKAKELLRKRVAVTGRITYRGGKPRQVKVDELRRLRERHELPQPEDIGPVDITGGLSSEDYVRRWRDGR